MEGIDYKKTIAGIVRKMRKEAGLTQSQLAEKLGVIQAQIWRWETGGTVPTGVSLLTISSVLNKPIYLSPLTPMELRPLTEMSNEEFHRYFKNIVSAPFTKDEVNYERSRLTNSKMLFSALSMFARSPESYEQLKEAGFDVTFNLDK